MEQDAANKSRDAECRKNDSVGIPDLVRQQQDHGGQQCDQCRVAVSISMFSGSLGSGVKW